MSLGLGTSLTKGGLVTPGIVTDSLVLKHNYAAGGVVPVSDGSALFDIGNTDYINIPSTGLSLNDWTMSCWVKVGSSNTPTHNGILSTRSSSDNDYDTGVAIQLENDSGYYFDIEGNATTGHIGKVAANTPVVGRWYHLAYTIDRDGGSGGVKQYVNGALVTTDTAVDSATSIDNIQIGARYYSTSVSQHFDGNICQVGIWDAVLTQAQIKSIMWKNYAGLTSSETDNLVSWWNLDTLTEHDSVGTGDGLVIDNHDTTLGSELLTGFTDGISYGFDTFTSSGRDISAAIETTGNWGACASNVFSVTAGEWYKCTFDLTYNSGTDNVRFVLSNDTTGGGTSRGSILYTSTNGANTMYFKVNITDSTCYLQIGTGSSSDVINFSMSNISLKKMSGNHGALT